MATNFDMIRRLGFGHFGEVWLAKDTALGVDRALKLIHPSKVLDPGNFFLEAQTLRAAEHPNVVRVEETGRMSNGDIYVAMELLSSGSLDDEAKGAFVGLMRAKQVMIDALRGLEHAHSCDILHRDIKPANIMIGNNGEGKLSDFGLALPSGSILSSLGTGAVGYIPHLSPEVHQGGECTVQSDVYACGVTLYRLVNGDSYFPRLSLDETEQACIAGKYPDRRRYREFVPRSLKLLINKAMNINPAKRFSSAQQMRHALEQVDLRMDFGESTLLNGHRWVGQRGGTHYEVVRVETLDGRWNVVVRQGKDPASLRRVTALCKTCASKSEATRVSQKTLQSLVLGRQP